MFKNRRSSLSNNHTRVKHTIHAEFIKFLDILLSQLEVLSLTNNLQHNHAYNNLKQELKKMTLETTKQITNKNKQAVFPSPTLNLSIVLKA